MWQDGFDAWIYSLDNDIVDDLPAPTDASPDPRPRAREVSGPGCHPRWTVTAGDENCCCET
jgi:hypothetical protein